MIREVSNNIYFDYGNRSNSTMNRISPTKPKNNLLSYIFEGGKERLSFFEQNKDNPRVLLDAINFFYGGVRSGESGEGNYFTFGSDGRGQIIPNFAVPRIDTASLPKLYATNNTLCLTSRSYYAFTGIDGKAYPFGFSGKNIEVAYSEEILGGVLNGVTGKCRKNIVDVMYILNGLAKGSSGFELMISKSTIKNALSSVGINPGEFRIMVDGEPKIYYLREDGGIRTHEWALKGVRFYNSKMWLDTHSVGDKVTIFGREYEIDENGKVYVPEEGFWFGDKCDTSKQFKA